MTTTLALQCGQLAVQFTRADDRYGHRIELLLGGRPTPLLESVEGSPEDDWPPSPPLQQLHTESREATYPTRLGSSHAGPLPEREGVRTAQTVALLVGMAGRSHWSLGVETVAGTKESGMQFDVACRLRSAAGRLASRYRVLVSARIDPQTGDVLLETDGICCRVRPEIVAGSAAQFGLANSVLTIQPPPALGGVPSTVRWRYSISLVSLGGQPSTPR